MQCRRAPYHVLAVQVLVGCSGVERAALDPPPSVVTTATAPLSASAPPEPLVPPIPMTVKTRSGFVVSPDGAHLATPASDPSERLGVAIHRLGGERAGSVAQFFAIGDAQMEFWLDATHAVASGSKSLWVLDLEQGTSTKLEELHAPIVTRDHARVIAFAGASRPVILEGPSLAERVTIQLELGETPIVRLSADESVMVASGSTKSVVATLDGVVKLELPVGGSHDDRTGISSRGTYLTRLVPVESGAALALFEVATGKELYRADPTFYPGASAVSTDEKIAVASADPSSAIRIELPSGRTRRLRGDTWDTEGYSYFTRRVGITEDGRFVCGHPVTTIGKYTNCNDEVLFSLGPRPRPRSAHCYVAPDGSATLAVVPVASIGEKRHAIPSASATYTKLCNSNISPDRSSIALAVVPDGPAKDASRYEDVELMVLRASDGFVEDRFALGPGPSSFGAVLNHDFSPSGRFLRVEWGEGMARTFDRRSDTERANHLTFEPTDTVLMTGDTELLVKDEPVSLALMAGSTLYPRHPL